MTFMNAQELVEDTRALLPFWPTAGHITSRGNAYELARRGEFPIKILTVGKRMKLRRADLLEYLGIKTP